MNLSHGVMRLGQEMPRITCWVLTQRPVRVDVNHGKHRNVGVPCGLKEFVGAFIKRRGLASFGMSAGTEDNGFAETPAIFCKFSGSFQLNLGGLCDMARVSWVIFRIRNTVAGPNCLNFAFVASIVWKAIKIQIIIRQGMLDNAFHSTTSVSNGGNLLLGERLFNLSVWSIAGPWSACFRRPCGIRRDEETLHLLI